MTDISNWWELVHITKTRAKNAWTGKEADYLIERIMVPLNEYQMANLIDAISQVQETGDWYLEFCSIVARAMDIGGIKELRSNRGTIFTLDDVSNGRLKREESVA